MTAHLTELRRAESRGHQPPPVVRWVFETHKCPKGTSSPHWGKEKQSQFKNRQDNIEMLQLTRTLVKNKSVSVQAERGIHDLWPHRL